MTRAPRLGLSLTYLLSAAVLLSAAAARGQLPTAELTSAFPMGGKLATSVDVTISGANLEDVTSLQFSHPGLSATPKMGPGGPNGKPPQPLANQFTVSISASVPVGVYEVRAVGKYGISNPRAFVVGNLTEVDGKQAGATAIAAKEVPLESTINGQASGERADFFRIAAKKDQRVLIESWAHRLDSKMDPAVVLLDPSGHEIARGKERQHRDILVDFRVPTDGNYTVKVYDFLYKGGGEYFYRLDVSTAPHVDFIMPPAGLAGTKSHYTIYGRNLPGGAPSDYKTDDGKPLEKIETDISLPTDPVEQQRLPIASVVEPSESFLDAYAYRLPTPRGEANPVDIFFATAPVVLEHEPNDKPDQVQKIEPPCEVVGQFNPRGDQDYYTFDAKKGDAYWIEVYSQRMGTTADPYLLVQRVKKNDKGVEQTSDIAEADDPQPNGKHERIETYYDVLGNDPYVRFTAPEDGTYRILVRDMYYESRGNPRFVYRLAVRRENPDFRVVAVAEAPQDPENANRIPMWTPLLHKGETTGVPVVAVRRDNFNGEIEVGVEGLPDGIKCPGVTLGPGSDVSTLVFSATDNVAPWSGTPKLVGKAKVNGNDVTREVRAGTIVWTINNREQEPLRFRMSSQLPLAVCGSDVPVAGVELGDGKPIETAIGGKLQIPVKVTRRGEFNGNLRLQPTGLPRAIAIPDANIGGGAKEGNLQVDVRSGVPVGTYTFACRVSTHVKYRHNPEAVAAATAAAKEADKTAADAVTGAKKAADDKAAADKAVADTTAAVKQAADALAAANKNLADAQAKLKPAQDAKAAAQKAADEAAGNTAAADKAKEAVDKKAAESDEAKAKALAEEKKKAEESVKQTKEKSDQAAAQFVAADKAVKDVEAAVAAATTTRTAAEKTSAEAAAKAKTAANAKPPIEAATSAAAEKSKAAEAEKQAANQKLQQANQVANPRDVLAVWYTTPVTVKIAATPIALSLTPPSTPAKPGDKVEIPITLGRLYGFNDTVTIGLADPNAGIRVPEVNIPPGQSQAKMMVELDGKATPGDHHVTIRARLNFNGQPSQLDQPLTLAIAAPPPEKK
jgi:hypothetical protein